MREFRNPEYDAPSCTWESGPCFEPPPQTITMKEEKPVKELVPTKAGEGPWNYQKKGVNELDVHQVIAQNV